MPSCVSVEGTAKRAGGAITQLVFPDVEADHLPKGVNPRVGPSGAGYLDVAAENRAKRRFELALNGQLPRWRAKPLNGAPS